MAFKLSVKACQDILKGDNTLANEDELERLRIELEQRTLDNCDFAFKQGQIYQQRQHIGLKEKAREQIS